MVSSKSEEGKNAYCEFSSNQIHLNKSKKSYKLISYKLISYKYNII